MDIKDKIKQIIFETTNIHPDEIADAALFEQDLNLDSLTMLELAVNIDQEFGLDFTEEEMKKLVSVDVSAKLVQEALSVQPT